MISYDIFYAIYRYDHVCDNPCSRITVALMLSICAVIIGLIFLSIVSVIGICLAALVLEILNYTYLAILMWMAGEEDIPSKDCDYYLWTNIEKFLKNHKSHKDKLLRIIAVNRIGYNHNIHCGGKLYEYLKSQENIKNINNPIPFSHMTFNDLANKCNEIHGSKNRPKPGYLFYSLFYAIMYRIPRYAITEASVARVQNPIDTDVCIKTHATLFAAPIATFILFPLYLLSRAFKILFPFIILVYIIINDLWLSLDMFQLFMLIFYLVILISLYLISIPAYNLYHIRWYINTHGSKKGVKNMREAQIAIQTINEYYTDCISIPIRHDLLIDIFGKDIGNIIESFCPGLDHWK